MEISHFLLALLAKTCAARAITISISYGSYFSENFLIASSKVEFTCNSLQCEDDEIGLCIVECSCAGVACSVDCGHYISMGLH